MTKQELKKELEARWDLTTTEYVRETDTGLVIHTTYDDDALDEVYNTLNELLGEDNYTLSEESTGVEYCEEADAELEFVDCIVSLK